MSVAELIEKLKDIPPDYTVTFDYLEFEFEKSVDINDDWKQVDFHAQPFSFETMF